MHDTTALVRPAASDYTPAENPRFVKLHRRFPTVAYLRRHARRHVPAGIAAQISDGRKAPMQLDEARIVGWRVVVRGRPNQSSRVVHEVPLPFRSSL